MFIHECVLERESKRARVRVCVCLCVCHIQTQTFITGQEKKKFQRAADKHMIMILCVVDVKASGLSNQWSVKQNTEPGGRKTICNLKSDSCTLFLQ